MAELLSNLGAVPPVPKDSPGTEPSEQQPFGLKDVTQSDLLPPGTPKVTPTTAPSAPVGPDLQTLASSVEDLKAQIARREEELGNLKNENAFYRQLGQFQQPTQTGIPPIQPIIPQMPTMPTYTQPTPTIPVATTFDYGNPEQAIDARAEAKARAVYQQMEQERLGREEQSRQMAAQQAQQRYVQVAYGNFQQGKSESFTKNPELFKGIEQVVENGMTDAFFRGLVTDSDLRNPATWERAAKMVWLEKGEFNKIIPNSPNPPRPFAGETPTQNRQMGGGVEPMQFDETTERIKRAFNLSDEDARRIIENERKNPMIDKGSGRY